MWQTKYALAAPKNLGVGVNFWPCSEGYFLSGRLWSKMMPKSLDPFGLDFGDFDQLQLIQGHFVPLQNLWVRVKAFAK